MVVLRGREGGRRLLLMPPPPPMSFSEPPVLLPLSRESHQHSLVSSTSRAVPRQHRDEPVAMRVVLTKDCRVKQWDFTWQTLIY